MKIISIASARPNFMKLAAVHHRLASRGAEHIIIHTGQHYDPKLSDVFFKEFAIPKEQKNLGIHGGTQEEVITKTKDALIPILQSEKPDWVIVYGDVNGALGGAQAAKETGCKLAHVEAGLRSFDMEMPEERNRIAIDKLADLFFCSEQSGVDNLKKEGFDENRINIVGNTMIDTLRVTMEIALKDKGAIKIFEENPNKNFTIATIHRPSNVDYPQQLRKSMEFLEEISKKIPVHLFAHPRLDAALQDMQHAIPEHSCLRKYPPQDHWSFVFLMDKSKFILTDSGGIQEEAVFLKKRCFTLRKNTERPSTLIENGGTNSLIDIDKPEDRQMVLDYAANPQPIDVKIPELWDGKAGERIATILLNS